MVKKIIKILALSIAGFVAVVVIIIYLLVNGMCGDEVIGEYISPDSKHVINYFVRDCGATTGFANNIEIDGNLILLAEPNDGNLSSPFQITWNDNNKVSIKVATNTNSFRIYTKPINQYKNIQIDLDQKIIDNYQRSVKATVK